MIKIIDGFGFEQDDTQFTLFAYGTRQKTSCFGRTAADGEMVEYKEPLGYFSTLSALCESCLKRAVNVRTDKEQVDSLAEYISIMQEIAKEIRNATKVYAES